MALVVNYVKISENANFIERPSAQIVFTLCECIQDNANIKSASTLNWSDCTSVKLFFKNKITKEKVQHHLHPTHTLS